MAENGVSPECGGSIGQNSEVSEAASESGGEKSVFSSIDAELERVSVREKNEHGERNDKNGANAFASTWEQLEGVSAIKKVPIEEREGGYHHSTYEELERVSIHSNREPETGEKKHESAEIKTVDINSRLNELRVEPEAAAEAINRNTLSDRIIKDNEFYVLPNELRGEKLNTSEAVSALTAIETAQRKNYLDTTKAKGFVQEEMIKSVLENDFDVSDKTVKSEHADGSITYTDIVASARNDVQLGDITIKQGEILSIESKAGDEKYLASQIDHISKQLEGMDKDSHRVLFVTSDYHRMNDKRQERLNNVLEKNDASLNVLPYYAHDLTNTIMHMDIEESQESDPAKSESGIKIPEGIKLFQKTAELQDEESVTDERFLSGRQERKEADSAPFEKMETEMTEKAEIDVLTLKERFETDKAETMRIISENKHLSELSESERNLCKYSAGHRC